MYKLRYSRRFKKDFKKINKNPEFKPEKLVKILDLLVTKGALGNLYKNHKLKGIFQDCFDCHIQPDVLLIYKIYPKNKVISLLRIGSHSDLF